MIHYLPMCRRYAIGLFLAFLSVAGFSSTFIFGSALTRVHAVSPTVLSFLRFAVAGLAMLAVGCASPGERAKLLAPRGRDWFALAALGIVGTSVMAWCVFMGCARVSAANASMADALTPLMIFSVAAIRSRRIAGGELFGLACGFVGALLVIQIVTPRGIALSAYSVGDVFILLAAATWGIYTVFGRDLINRLGSTAFTAWTMLFGALAVGLVLPFGGFAWPADRQGWSLALGLGLVSTLMPFWTWNAAQKFLPMSVLGLSAYFTPVITVALAIVFLGESATPLQWLGTVFVIASAAVETRTSAKAGAS